MFERHTPLPLPPQCRKLECDAEYQRDRPAMRIRFLHNGSEYMIDESWLLNWHEHVAAFMAWVDERHADTVGAKDG